MRRLHYLLMLIGFVSFSFGQFNPNPNQWYKFINKNSRYNLQPVNSSTADAANIVQIANSGASCQQWKFISAGNGYYTIQNNASSKVMDINGASKNAGASLIQYHSTGAANQLWQIVNIGNGYLTIKNKNSGLVLDISGASKSSGAQCIQSSSNGSVNQQWQIVLISQNLVTLSKNKLNPKKTKTPLLKQSMATLGKMLNTGISLPAEFNWRDSAKINISSCYNQGKCGSCWAFAAKNSYEIKLNMKGFSPVNVSVEQQIACNTAPDPLGYFCSGCSGGFPFGAWEFWQSTQPELWSCTKYPDSIPHNTTCYSLPSCANANLPLMGGSYYIIDPVNIDDIKASVYWDGPGVLNLGIYDNDLDSTDNDKNGNNFSDFWNGLAEKNAVYIENGTDLFVGGHSVTLLGWSDSKQAWLCKNSWGLNNVGDSTFWIAYSGHKHSNHLMSDSVVNTLYFYTNQSALGGNFWTTTGNGSASPGIRRYVRSADGTYSFVLVPYPSGVNSVSSIAGDPRGHVYIADTSGMVYSRNPNGSWNKIPGIDAWEITSAYNFSGTAPVNYVFAVTQDGHLYALNSTGNGWNQVNTGPCASVHKVDVDCGGTIYMAGGTNDNSGNSAVWRLKQGSNTWEQMGGYTSYVSDIASDSTYGTVIVGPYGHQSGLWLWNEGAKTWNQIPGTESMSFSCIDVGPEGIFGLIDWQTPAVYTNGTWTVLGQYSDPSISNVGCSSWR